MLHIHKIFIFILIFFFKSFSYSENIKEEFLKDINNIFPSEIFFEQRQNNDKKYIEGWMIIGDKGLARTEFSPPNNQLIIADGKWLILHDALYNRTSYFPLNYGLFSVLLEPKKIVNFDEYKVEKYINNSLVEYIITSEKNGINAKLEIFFRYNNKKKINEIFGWNIIEGNKFTTKIKVTKFKKIEKKFLKKKNYFKLNEDMRKKREVFLGPWPRKLKIIPTHGKPN